MDPGREVSPLHVLFMPPTVVSYLSMECSGEVGGVSCRKFLSGLEPRISAGGGSLRFPALPNDPGSLALRFIRRKNLVLRVTDLFKFFHFFLAVQESSPRVQIPVWFKEQ